MSTAAQTAGSVKRAKCPASPASADLTVSSGSVENIQQILIFKINSQAAVTPDLANDILFDLSGRNH